MKKLLLLLLLCCLVLSLAAPVSAGDYWFEKNVNATDLVDELIRYVNTNSSIDDWGWKLSGHKVERWYETTDMGALYIEFTCKYGYSFCGELRVNPQGGMKTPYTLTIINEDKGVIAEGEGWLLNVRSVVNTRFKA